MKRLVLGIATLIASATVAISASSAYGQGAIVVRCSDTFGPDVGGVWVFAPNGSINFLCNFPGNAPGPRGAIHIKCEDLVPGLRGPGLTFTPSGHAIGGCTF
jgi:hypothetical protein